MKTHPRIRKTVKWGGLGLSLALTGLMIGSVWPKWTTLQWGQDNPGPDWCAYVACGQVTVLRNASHQSHSHFEPGFTLHATSRPGFLLWLEWHHYPGVATWLSIPLWMIVVPCAAIALVAWRLEALARRRARLNLCPKCDYDRTGLAAGTVCPECGTSPIA